MVSPKYERLRRALGGEALPAALVDLDALEANADVIAAQAKRLGKALRIATKSVRSPDLLKLLQQRTGARGFMTYSAAESLFLRQQGFDDLLLAYPTLRDAEALKASGAVAAVDCVEQVEALRGVPMVVDVDMSLRVLGQHLGVRRSPLRTAPEVVALARRIPAGDFRGVLAYEAQIAGLPDFVPGARARTLALQVLKARSRREVAQRRAQIAAALDAAGLPARIFNGGGTGSLAAAPDEPALTEVTAGSGFLASHLFDYLSGLALKPALYFALQATRRPAPGIVTCAGGGIVASGAAGPDRLPKPALPEGLALLPLEGAGEVQTPVQGFRGALGDPIFFRPAKAGEPAERFDSYLLVRGDKAVGRAQTYRGLRQCFG